MSNNGLISGSFSTDTTISTPVAINKGGTGQTTAQAALDALAAASGTLVRGDIFTVDSSLNMVRLARGSDNQTMMMNGSDVNWETVAAAGGAWTNIGSDSATSNQAALTVSGFTAMDILQVIFHGEEADSLAFPVIRINDLSTTTYSTRLLNNATVVTVSSTGYSISQDTTAAHTTDCVAYIFNANSNLSFDGTMIRFMSGNFDAAGVPSYLISGSGSQSDVTDPVTQIDIVGDSGDIKGTLQVNGMDY